MMKGKIATCLLFAVILAWSASWARPALAYLDPGTGAMVLQLLLGGVAGVIMVVKLYWAKIKGFFVRSPGHPASKNDQTVE